MGLESHVDRVLKEQGIPTDVYYWRNGLNIWADLAWLREQAAKIIMEALDSSGQFGPTRYNEETRKIEFGVFCDFFPGEKSEYNQYREDFKNWLVDAGGEKRGDKYGCRKITCF